jgi:hypothetical protein
VKPADDIDHGFNCNTFRSEEHSSNLRDFRQAYFVVFSFEFKPTGNPLWVAYAVLREKTQGQQVCSP